MPDSSVAITAGSGIPIDTRTESTNSHHRQVIVIGDPDTNAAVAPVDATNGLAVHVLGDALTALQVMDDWDETNRCAVNLVSGQAGITAGAGAVGASTPRVTLASDDPGVAHLSNIETAIQILDDWDETNRAAVNVIAGQVGVTAGAGAVSTNTPRMTLASDDPAVVALQVIDDWDETNRCAVNVISGQAGIAAGAGAVGVTVPRVTLASDDPAVTALQIIDDWDETDRAKVNIIAGQAGIAANSGTASAATPRVTVATDDSLVTDSTQIRKSCEGEYETVAASQTAQQIGATGAAGDWLEGVLIVPATVSPGSVDVLDGATSIEIFAGGTDSLLALAPIYVPLGMEATDSDGWNITTGANVACIAIGSFT